jgi:hypothetical protein
MTSARNVIFKDIAGTQFVLGMATSTAPTVDMMNIINTGGSQGAATTGVDGLQIDFLNAGSGGTTNSGLQINVTSAVNVVSTYLYGINIGNMSGQTNATEYALNIGTGWDRGLSIGDTTNYVALSESTAPVLAGTARPYRKITLSPEYAGAVLSTFYGAGTGSNITGNMTSDASPSGALMRTHYSWSSSTASPLQEYTVAVRITLPSNFSAWCSGSIAACTGNTDAIVVNYNTLAVEAANNALDAYGYNTAGTQLFADTANVVGSLDGWGTITVAYDSLSNWNTANSTAVIYLRMQAMNNYHVLLGDIVLNYVSNN